MQRLCDKYNRAIDSIHQLVSIPQDRRRSAGASTGYTQRPAPCCASIMCVCYTHLSIVTCVGDFLPECRDVVVVYSWAFVHCFSPESIIQQLTALLAVDVMLR